MSALNPGFGGSALLLLASLCYLPNSVIWAIAYMLGPGFSFGTGTALFHVCSRCGAVPVVTSRLDGRDYAVVSVTAFTDVDPALIRRAGASFEGESREERLARRKRNWIGAVEFTAGARAP